MIDPSFWQGRKVFITGHTGFKGSWLSLWLQDMGAEVTGYALHPHTTPSMYKLCKLEKLVSTYYKDIRDMESLRKILFSVKPEIIIHMAAQTRIRESYRIPWQTYDINVMGTANLLEIVRELSLTYSCVRAVINVTIDQCYENKAGKKHYRESDALGGGDPYSNSKACAELLISAYRSSFFHPECYSEHQVAIASARTGNVIGGGDWSKDRLIPDILDSLGKAGKVQIHNPNTVRSWQHVLEPLGGYLLLAQKLLQDGKRFADGWNFGHSDGNAKTVGSIVKLLCSGFGKMAAFDLVTNEQPPEKPYVKLNSSKSKLELGWQPKWNVKQAIDKILEWDQAYRNGEEMREASSRQIRAYMGEEA
ncbi:CDP-glucose 4,6-dehydratase [Paenibacillus eucommiae]|uniref:CDP-glucose 4,6-dehydratase n=1 Tax=Paenibacillus eucommiae TaxID=1355755 RepID=A0ABS4J0D9_9BACL|nr:CDP-glucose 4,6-dehydratase [Paenibacillus eucommiae]MBP1993312.1 CDP-glucose 4,6-dehydratase [Paenibacillus eucommiae]